MIVDLVIYRLFIQQISECVIFICLKFKIGRTSPCLQNAKGHIESCAVIAIQLDICLVAVRKDSGQFLFDEKIRNAPAVHHGIKHLITEHIPNAFLRMLRFLHGDIVLHFINAQADLLFLQDKHQHFIPSVPIQIADFSLRHTGCPGPVFILFKRDIPVKELASGV